MKKKASAKPKKIQAPKNRSLQEIQIDRQERRIAESNHRFENAIGSFSRAIKANRDHYASQIHIAETAMSKKMKRK